ncbi:ABC transporter ATP-binding protein [soil metagenome]
MSAITFKHVHKYFYLQHQKTLKEFFQALFFGDKTLSRVHALKDITFTIEKGESVAIVGRNGAGKSTLLKIIAGVSSPTTGSVHVAGRVSPLIELGAGFHPELSGRENIFLNGVIMGLREDYIHSKFDEIVAFSEIAEFIDMPVKYYSSGMYMRLAFSVAIHVNPDILLIDEILSVGDMAFQKKCMDKMFEFKKSGKTILFISHAIAQIEQFCDRVIYIKEGTVSYDGETKIALEHYKKDLNPQS